MGRGAISNRRRFEVFSRDRFTCQYCGTFATDCLLEIDHIMPASRIEGKGTEKTNLITACSKCNNGKSDSILPEVVLELLQDGIKKREQELLDSGFYNKK